LPKNRTFLLCSDTENDAVLAAAQRCYHCAQMRGSVIQMFRKPLSRKEKETRYIEKSSELQRIWRNPVSINDEAIYQQHVEKLSDAELDRDIEERVGQIQFEKGIAAVKTVVKTAIGIFVILGVAGLLLFGIRQLFTLSK
jgi:hypothetical protein